MFKLVVENTPVPKRMTNGSAGLDLSLNQDLFLGSREIKRIKTGMKMQIPKGYFVKIEARSSAIMQGVNILGGVIDSDYRGEIEIICQNLRNKIIFFEKGQRIAQMLFLTHAEPLFEIVQELDKPTALQRTGGFGSTTT